MEKEIESSEIDESRRKFIETAGKVSVAAPAAAVLLSSAAQAQSADPYGSDPGGPAPA